jgi:Domain of unknown function (DUF4157)
MRTRQAKTAPAPAPEPEPALRKPRRAPQPAAVLRRVAAAGRATPNPAELAQIHRMVGNRGMRRLLAAGGLRAKLVVGRRGDRHEREADRLAAQAMDSGSAGTVRERMEQVLGADLSGVRIHADSRADALNDALHSRAFTIGSDVYVRRGEYRPGTARGDALLAHELAHTVQPGAADVIRRAPTVWSMDNAWSEMSRIVEGLHIVDFIVRVRKAGSAGVPDKVSAGFTWNDLLTVVGTAEGRKYVESKWRDKGGTPWGGNQVIQGQHEWILTKSVGYVLSKATKWNNVANWLMALDILRVPTSEVIFPIEFVKTTGLTEQIADLNESPQDYTASTMGILGGHPGAMYAPRPPGGKERKPKDHYRQVTTYQGKFHKQLDVLMKKYLNDKKDDLEGFLNALISFQEQQVWGGEIPGLDLEKARQIRNDLRDSPSITAGVFGAPTPFANVAEIQQFAREAKPRNADIMTHRANALVQHQSKLGFAAGEYWSTLPKKPVYVTDESGKTVDDYTHMEEDDTEQQTPYTVPTTQARDVPARPATLNTVPADVLQKFGTALFAEQQQLEARTGAVNAEVARLINESYEKEKAGLAGVADAAKALSALNAKYGKAMSEAQDHFDDYQDARKRLDVWLFAQQTTKTTRTGLEQLYREYCTKANGLLDGYVANIKTLFGA